jgi:hypothetical protein
MSEETTIYWVSDIDGLHVESALVEETKKGFRYLEFQGRKYVNPKWVHKDECHDIGIRRTPEEAIQAYIEKQYRVAESRNRNIQTHQQDVERIKVERDKALNQIVKANALQQTYKNKMVE